MLTKLSKENTLSAHFIKLPDEKYLSSDIRITVCFYRCWQIFSTKAKNPEVLTYFELFASNRKEFQLSASSMRNTLSPHFINYPTENLNLLILLQCLFLQLLTNCQPQNSKAQFLTYFGNFASNRSEFSAATNMQIFILGLIVLKKF